MNVRLYNTLLLLRQFAFIAVVYAMVVQPVVTVFLVNGQADYEIAEFDGEEDTEEERQEDDKIEEKTNLQILYAYTHNLFNGERWSLSQHGRQHPSLNLILEIPIPPPEFL